MVTRRPPDPLWFPSVLLATLIVLVLLKGVLTFSSAINR